MLHFLNSPSEARRLTDFFRASSVHSRTFDRKGGVAEEDASLQIVLEGAVLRQRFLPDGRCHAVAVYYRDDILNLASYVGSGTKRRGSDSLMALRGTVIGSVPDASVSQMRALAPSGQDGISVLAFRELGILQERSLSIAACRSIEAMAHFFCETAVRCGRDPSKSECKYALHLTQDSMSSILGITPVHVSRTLQDLRHFGFADLCDNQLIIYDFDRLAQLANFDDYYLEPI